jgi:hypothetical protein
MIPVLRPLKDPAVATVWSGLAASTIGEDLFRVAVIWIAAEQIGNAAGYVNAAQYGAMLAVGLLGASLFDRWRADRAMIGAKYASAVLALLPVAGFYVWGISIPLLVISVMGLAAMRMVFNPALQSAGIVTLAELLPPHELGGGVVPPPPPRTVCTVIVTLLHEPAREVSVLFSAESTVSPQRVFTAAHSPR